MRHQHSSLSFKRPNNTGQVACRRFGIVLRGPNCKSLRPAPKNLRKTGSTFRRRTAALPELGMGSNPNWPWLALAAGWPGGSVVAPEFGTAPAARYQTARAGCAGLQPDRERLCQIESVAPEGCRADHRGPLEGDRSAYRHLHPARVRQLLRRGRVRPDVIGFRFRGPESGDGSTRALARDRTITTRKARDALPPERGFARVLRHPPHAAP